MNQAGFNATGEYKYENPSQEVLKEMTDTLPVKVIWGDFLFDQEGIGAYHDYDEDKDYISACSEKGVIPNFFYELNYHFDRDENEGNFICRSMELENNRVSEPILNALLSGGKASAIKIRLGYLNGSQAGFEKFKDKLYDKLTDEGYVMYHASLWLTTSKRAGMPQNYNDVDTGIKYSASDKELILDLSSRDDEDEMEMHKQLYDWFIALGEKHNLDIKSRDSGWGEWS